MARGKVSETFVQHFPTHQSFLEETHLCNFYVLGTMELILLLLTGFSDPGLINVSKVYLLLDFLFDCM